MGVRRYHVERDAVHTEHLADIQAGRTSVGFGFSVAGEENVTATISFPKAFAEIPVVVVAVEGVNVGIVRIDVSKTGFTIYVRDDKGTDYTTSQPATVNWIAVAV